MVKNEPVELEIVYLDPHELTPYENNTRKHSPEDIDQIKASIQADGFNDPIGIWGEKNLIVEGHGRQIAALEMGLDKIPCIRLDHMTDTQRRDYAIRHNRTAELSAWDFGKLEEELAQLEIEGIDLSGLDFDVISGGGHPEYDSPSAAEPQGWKPLQSDEGFKEEQAPLSKEELAQYENNADDFLLKRRVIITFMPEQEEEIRRMLGITEEKMRVVYDINELVGGGEE